MSSSRPSSSPSAGSAVLMQIRMPFVRNPPLATKRPKQPSACYVPFTCPCPCRPRYVFWNMHEWWSFPSTCLTIVVVVLFFSSSYSLSVGIHPCQQAINLAAKSQISLCLEPPIECSVSRRADRKGTEEVKEVMKEVKTERGPAARRSYHLTNDQARRSCSVRCYGVEYSFPHACEKVQVPASRCDARSGYSGRQSPLVY